MKKSDLKSKMAVKLRNGNKYLVVDDVVINEKGYMPLNEYDEDLLHAYEVTGLPHMEKDEEFDIVAVYEYYTKNYFTSLWYEFGDDWKLIWERKEKTLQDIISKKQFSEMTADEIAKEFIEMLKFMGIEPKE